MALKRFWEVRSLGALKFRGLNSARVETPCPFHPTGGDSNINIALMDDWELIKAYADNRSETAFKTLVERYAGLVYGSALRQARDAELARDIAQAVFILLGRKAGSFQKQTILSGWLFQTTRFVTSRAIRSEQRRQRREQEAVQMHDSTSTDAAWREMEPLVDDALHELRGSDRDAVLIRYVEGRSIREVGARLGITEEAAKKRIGRAVEKLRQLLTQRGVALSATVLASALTGGLNAAVPSPLLSSLVSSLTLSAGDSSTLVTQVINAWRWGKIKAAAGFAAAALVMTALLVTMVRPASRSNSAALRSGEGLAAPTTTLQATTAAFAVRNGRSLRLRAIDDVSGAPITNAPVAVVAWSNDGLETNLDLFTDAFGLCDVPFPPQTGRLDVGVLTTGWSARFATWPSEGIAEIPTEYTLRLERTTNVIGGQILDPNGQPLAGAQVWFQARGTGDHAQHERPRERFGFLYAVPVRTDAQGRWTMGFVPTRSPGFSLWTTHEQFARTTILSLSGDEATPEPGSAAEQLWSARLITRITPGLILSGKVIDSQSKPVSGAKIQHRSQEKPSWSDQRGEFLVRGLSQGPWAFTVSADGFGPVRKSVEIHAGIQPMIITLQTGAVLRLHIVDEHDLDVSGATIGLEQWGENRHSLEWSDESDFGGEIEWSSAPPGVELELYAKKEGFCFTRDVHVKADGEVHLVRLQHALTIYGRVVDAETGYAIRQFKAVPGYGFEYHDNESHWFAGETVAGTNGLFQLTFNENRQPWQVRITADGYEDWISGRLETNEFTATLDVALKRGSFSESSKGVVLKPDGSPAADAQVALLALDHNVRLLRKGVFSGNKRWLATTGTDGRFQFPVNRSAHSVAAVSPDGYARVRVSDFGAQIQLQLQPWGAVSGIIDAGARNYPVETIELYDPTADNYQGRISLLGAYSTQVDADGRFNFEKVPPGEFSVFINSLRGLSYHHQTPLKVMSGETTEVTIVEKPGVLLKGRIVIPDGTTIDWIKDRVVVRVERESLRHAPGWSGNDEKKLEAVDYWTSPVAREFSNSRRMTDLDVRSDGSFVSVERVTAGDYLLFAVFKNASMNRKISISPEQETLPELDIGSLELRPRGK